MSLFSRVLCRFEVFILVCQSAAEVLFESRIPEGIWLNTILHFEPISTLIGQSMIPNLPKHCRTEHKRHLSRTEPSKRECCLIFLWLVSFFQSRACIYIHPALNMLECSSIISYMFLNMTYIRTTRVNRVRMTPFLSLTYKRLPNFRVFFLLFFGAAPSAVQHILQTFTGWWRTARVLLFFSSRSDSQIWHLYLTHFPGFCRL